ncbi:MAG: hypothetical protein GX853_06365 [Chloroflexi bacterium]|mgnify:FL=1|jgi:hypothetical protein|nr:hypothetical protein [Chloroflexota bacterium]
MERQVPIRSSDEIDLYLRTIYSLLRSNNEVSIRTLEEVHAGTNSSLHIHARSSKPDISALIYSLMRLPEEIVDAKKVVLGQSASIFEDFGYGNIEKWQHVTARARRRRCFWDGEETLGCFIASRSDIDDVIPVLTALQMEWNKLHLLIQSLPVDFLKLALPSNHEVFKQLCSHLDIGEDDLARLFAIWGDRFTEMLAKIHQRPFDFKVRLLSGSLNDYRKATVIWWDNIQEKVPEIINRPIYFVSSNTHSLTNLLSGFALSKKDEILRFIHDHEPALSHEWEEINSQGSSANAENFFYYAMRKLMETDQGGHYFEELRQLELSQGIHRVSSDHSFDVEANIIQLKDLDPKWIDPRLAPEHPGFEMSWEFLKQSDALILNIDYPLGASAYNLLTKIAENVDKILGVYIMGKAASLNAVRGDVIIPNVVYDEHSKNSYLFSNCFKGTDVSHHLNFGTVLDSQKAVTVLGTYLQNATVMDVVYREGYTDIEMEAGPYLSAVYEMFRPARHPLNEIVNLYDLPFDLGFLHYVSDTPFSKGQNLGAGSLSYFGMDSTYAVSLAILKRIMKRERQRLNL